MRVLYLHPIFTPPAAVEGAKALGYDPLKSQAARAFEDTRAFGRERFAEKNAICPVYDALQSRAPLFKRILAKVAAVKVQQIKGDESRAGGPGCGSQRVELAVAIGKKDDRLAVEERIVHG